MTAQILAPARTVVLPRVNLLPPEIEQERKQRQLRAICLLVGACAPALVGLLYIQASGDVGAAQDELAVAQTDATRLQQDVRSYANVPAVYASVATAQTQAEQALGGEVRWSLYLDDIARTMPKKVWLTKVAVTTDVPTAAVPGAPAATGGLGTVVITGRGFAHNDVAAWVDRLAAIDGHTDATFTRSVDAKIGERNVVEFESNAVITADRLSGRYITKAGD